MAFVGRALPSDDAAAAQARERLVRAGVDVTLGRCHLNPVTIEKNENDFCLQHRPCAQAAKR